MRKAVPAGMGVTGQLFSWQGSEYLFHSCTALSRHLHSEGCSAVAPSEGRRRSSKGTSAGRQQPRDMAPGRESEEQGSPRR